MSGMDETSKAVSLCSGIYLGVSVHMSMVPLFPQSIRDNVEDHLASTHHCLLNLEGLPALARHLGTALHSGILLFSPL